MRVHYDNDITAKRGKCKRTGKFVYFARANGTLGFQRINSPQRITNHNILYGQKMKAAAMIWKDISDGFREYLKRYTELYNQTYKAYNQIKINGYTIFVGALMKFDTPLDSVTELVSEFGATIEDWMTMGILKKVKTKTPLNADIQF